MTLQAITTSEVETKSFNVNLPDGSQVNTSSFTGKVLMVAIIKLNTCHAGWAIELIDEMVKFYNRADVVGLGCCVDRVEGDTIWQFPRTPVGWARRREIAELLDVPMSGFHLPKYLVFDRHGRMHHYGPDGKDGEAFVEHHYCPAIS